MVNGFFSILQGEADIEVRNNRQQTPLMLAVTQAHTPVVNLLLEKGARVATHDEDGDSPLHLVLLRLNQNMAANSAHTATKNGHPVSIILV